MTDFQKLRSKLEKLAEILASYGGDFEMYWSERIERVLASNDDHVRAFLVSNDLWGGAGSIADQAGLDEGLNIREDVEATLVELGEEQINAGIVNSRTEFWVRGAKKILENL